MNFNNVVIWGDSLKKSGSWLKGRGSGLNFVGDGESKRQLQRKR